MKPKLFISYSRRQIPFVDRLADQLEDSGYSIWLDYQSLVPARPWLAQIESGIDGGDVFLLVVSQESIASEHVAVEWNLALEFKKPIILLIFEAISLPKGLQHCEWVDFRTSFKQSVQELMKLLENPGPIIAPPPQKGFRAPLMFWIALALSVVVMIVSIPNWWLLLIPYVLVPLPWQIYKRNYMIYRVMPVLLYLPFIYLFTIPFTGLEGEIFESLQGFMLAGCCIAPLASWILLALLVTPTMQRRGLPEASEVRFANPLEIEVQYPRSVGFTIDHAPEDGRYADDIRRALEEHGHRMVDPDETPEAVLVLISAHKTASKYNPDHLAVYPILLQPIRDIDPTLQRIQWIDFRKGIQNVHKLAILLPEPEGLLKALAVPPTGNQEVYPLTVLILEYFYLIMGILGMSALVMFFVSLGPLMSAGALGKDQLVSLFLAVLNGILLNWSVLFSLRVLRSRRGGASTLYPLSVLTIFQMAVHLSLFWNLLASSFTYAFKLDPSLSNIDPLVLSALFVALLNNIIIMSGFFVGISILLFRWRELYRWLPRPQVNSSGRLENLLLLYTPLQRHGLFYHGIFHVMLIAFYLLLNMEVSLRVLMTIAYDSGFLSDRALWDTFFTVGRSMLIILPIPIILTALAARWQARQVST